MKNFQKPTMPRCHTISVVMSPKGLNAPPALAATTMLMQPSEMKRALPAPTASNTAHSTSAVVRLSRNGDSTNASPPVIQNSERYPRLRRSSQQRSAAKTLRSLIALT